MIRALETVSASLIRSPTTASVLSMLSTPDYTGHLAAYRRHINKSPPGPVHNGLPEEGASQFRRV